MVAGFVLCLILCRKKNKTRTKPEPEILPYTESPDWQNSLYD